ncbi:MAG: ABC transporter permease, partial [Candidatus Poribacteria bacterium]|nr:ABC transporter permease [Candidatus Poribacteria bacterium]
MRLIEGLSIGIAAMRANKMRSLLTMLGIIIGIAAVLAMIAIGDGAKEIVIQDAQKMGGATRITLYQTSYKRENNRWVRIRSNEYMEYEDALAIEAECPSVNAVTPRIADWRGVLFQGPGGTEARAGYNGVGPTYATAMDWDIKEGRFITDEDVQNATKICVLGDELATELFGNKSPLGQEIKIARDVGYYDPGGRRRRERLTERFTVVGTFMPRG